jgi:hypothetical protein
MSNITIPVDWSQATHQIGQDDDKYTQTLRSKIQEVLTGLNQNGIIGRIIFCSNTMSHDDPAVEIPCNGINESMAMLASYAPRTRCRCWFEVRFNGRQP